MKRPYLGLWTLLAISFVAFAALSKCDGLDIGNIHLKTGTFVETLFTPAQAETAKNAVKNAQSTNKANCKKAKKPRPAYIKTDTTSKTILFIGDSMLEGLGPRMAAYAKKNGDTLISVIWYSSTTEIWGRSKKLKEYIHQFHPNYILICLGANELFIRDIKTKRQKYVDNMLSQIGNIPYVWIGPPNWKPDTGINELIESSVKENCFYLSDGQHYDRAKDGAHPTRKSAAQWMDRVCKWIVASSAHPIKLDVPTEAKAHCRTIVLQPVR
jgi:hypothetical protein